MELKDFDVVRGYTKDGKDYVLERDYAKLMKFATEQDKHIKCLQEELGSAKTESAQAIQEQNERLTETIKQIDDILEQCFGVRHTDFKNDVEMKDALQGYVKIKLPQEPIGVAEYLITATRDVKATLLHNLCQALSGEEQSEVAVEDMYSCSDLRQIAEHLLVYCNAHKEEE